MEGELFKNEHQITLSFMKNELRGMWSDPTP